MESSRDSIVLHEDSQDGTKQRPDPNQPTPRDPNSKRLS
jgi:hypothetical protein